jgi:hypothetical protein
MLESDSQIGQLIAELRGERTQQSVAAAMRRLGWRWSQATVWSVEKGERPLKLREAADLAVMLGTTVETLLGTDHRLVLLLNKLTHVQGNIASHQKKVTALDQELAETKAALERLQQEGLALEDAFRAGAEASENRDELALLAELLHRDESAGRPDEQQDGHSAIT